jgi:hypothetical protein
MKLAIGFMILCGLYGFVLTCWHLKLMVYLHREHTPEWQKLGPLIFGNQLWPYSIRYPVWSWRSLGFFLFKRYKILNDPEFVCRARSFRSALIIWLLTLGILTIAALYWNPY